MQFRRNEFESGPGTGPERKCGGALIRRKAPGKFFGRALHFLALKALSVVSASAFVMVSTVWSVSCLLFSYSRCPRAQPFVKVGARAPRSPGSRRHCMIVYNLKQPNCKLSANRTVRNNHEIIMYLVLRMHAYSVIINEMHEMAISVELI